MNDKEQRILEMLSKTADMTAEDNDGRHDWNRVAADMNAWFPDHQRSAEAWRSKWRIAFNQENARQLRQGTARRDDKRAGRYSDQERLLGLTKSKRRMDYLIEKLGIDEVQILGLVSRLQLNGYNVKVWNEGDALWVYDVPVVETGEAQIKNLQASTTIKIAVVGDTHLGSKFEAVDQLEDFYEYASSKGVTEFYHVGDISDGYYKNRDGSIFEQHKLGFQDQLDYIAKVYPKIEGCLTYFITGNHDATHINNGGANIGKCLGKCRDDLIYLGHNFAKVWLTEKVDMNLMHPADGVSQAISYKAQRIVDNATGNRKAKIICIGHYHKMNYSYYKDTHALLVPSFQWQTAFMAGHNLMSIVGGYILTIKVDDDGNLISFTPEFVEFNNATGGDDLGRE